MKKTVWSLMLVLLMVVSLFIGVAVIANAAEDKTDHTNHDTDWQAISEVGNGVTTLTAGNYYLSQNITAGNTIEIGENQVVTLCLNGKVLTLSTTNSTIRLAAGSTLNICDCQAGTVTTYGNINENGVWVKADVSGNADLSGGVITRSVDRATSPLISSAAENTTLNMYSGNLAGNRRSGDNSYAHHRDAAGISLQTSSSSINLYGGTLTGLVAPKGASAIYAQGSLNLAGAVIEKNRADNSSTIVWLQSSGSAASMTGGAIRNNSAYQSGAIFMYSGNETFTMSGGEISGNQALHGGVQVDSGTFKMTGGEIKNNVATGDGGGIFAGGGGDGIAEISGGKIYGNTAANNGGGVCVGNNAVVSSGISPTEGCLKVSGGKIYGNTAAKHGSGVYVAAISTNTLELSGDAYIYENFKSDGVSANNVTLYGDASLRTSHQKITVGTFTSNAKVGVGFENVKGYRTFTKGATTDVTSVFVSDNSDLILSMGSDGQAMLGYEIRLQLNVPDDLTHWEADDDRTELTVTATMYNAKGEVQNATFTYAWRRSTQQDLSNDTSAATEAGNATLRILVEGKYYYFCNVEVTNEMAPPIRSEATYVVLHPYTFVTISAGPQSIELYPNELAADHKLTVTATVDYSESSLIYRWYMTLPGGTETEIPGATGAEYIIPKDLPVGKTTFKCVVDAEGASYPRSTSATVTVKAPEITITPKYGSDQISITMLDEYTLEITATCNGFDGNLQYQWYTCRYNDGTGKTIITGATSASYTFKPDSSGNKYFICEVTAGGTTQRSAVAKLYVQSANVYINTDIPNYANYNVAQGGTRTLTIAASGPQGIEIGYQWYRCTDSSKGNATPVEGATGASFNVPTDTKGTCYYFCRAYLVGHDTIYKDSRVAQINVYVAYNVTTADPADGDGIATVTGGKYHVNPTCAGGGYCSIDVEPDEGYTVDTITVYKTGAPSVIVYSGSYTSFEMPEYDVTVKVTFKVPTPIEKVDLQIDWSRLPGIAVGDDLLAIDYEFSDSYLPAVFVDGEGVCNGSVHYTYLAIKVTNANAQRIADATGYDAEELLDWDGYGTWLPVYSLGYYADEFILDANDELAIMVYIYAYDGYFPSDDDGMYTGAVTCNNESVAFNVAYYDEELISFIEAGKVSEITAKQTNAGTADRYNVYFYDNYGYTNGGSYGVMPGIVKEGETVTIRITPNAGYEIDTVSWISFVMPSDIEGEDMNVVTAVGGIYTFTMPASDVIVKVTFKKTAEEHEHSYTYTSNNNGSHNGACACGEDAITNQACTFVGGACDKCGYTEPAAPPAHTHSYTYTSNNNATHNGACACGEDAITNQACTLVGGTCNKCGYSAPVTPPPTEDIPVSNGENEVDAKAEVSGSDATIKPLDKEQIKQLLNDEDGAGDIVIDLTRLGKDIDTAGIPKSTLEAILEAAEEADSDTEHLIIKLSTAELKFDDAAIRAIVEQASGDVIKFNFDDVGLNRLNEAQKGSVEDLDIRKGYEAYITVNDQRIGDFKGGEVEITVPYVIPEGEDVASFSVWYVNEDGTLEKQESTYDGKEKWFVVSHFSDYIIVYDAPDAPENNSHVFIWIILIIIIIILVGVAVYFYLKKKKEQNEVTVEETND